MTLSSEYVSPVINSRVQEASREWGEEELLVFVPGVFTMKRIKLYANRRGGLQYHRLKNEAGYIISGKLIVRYFDPEQGALTEKILGPGDFFHFPEYCIHQEQAIDDTEIIEVSSAIFNDRVRVEHLFGHSDSEIGLPTTLVKEISRIPKF